MSEELFEYTKLHTGYTELTEDDEDYIFSIINPNSNPYLSVTDNFMSIVTEMLHDACGYVGRNLNDSDFEDFHGYMDENVSVGRYIEIMVGKKLGRPFEENNDIINEYAIKKGISPAIFYPKKETENVDNTEVAVVNGKATEVCTINIERNVGELTYAILNTSNYNGRMGATIVKCHTSTAIEDYGFDYAECVGISMLKANEESIFDISLTEKWGLGTGVIVSEDGYILTNQHLARSANTRLIVNLENGETAQGKVIWCDENVDLAVVKIDKKNLVPAKIGNSDNLKIGEEVLAIGNPLGVEFQRTTTKGIVSGLNRTLQFEENGNTVLMEDLIQTDASINTGNSGGPLINLSGEVVGINTVKITSAEGMGFAVPIDIVLPILNKIENGKKIKEAKLGMFVYDKEIVKYMKSNKNIEKGLYVTDVSKLGAADKAGIRKGDVLISVDGVELDKVTDLRRYIYEKEVGDTVSFIINRNNRIENLKVELK